MSKVFCLIIFIFLSACSAKELYQAKQGSHRSMCDKYVGYEKEQCLKEVDNTPYEEYEKTRKAIIEEKNESGP